jgi:hypothetical protein
MEEAVGQVVVGENPMTREEFAMTHERYFDDGPGVFNVVTNHRHVSITKRFPNPFPEYVHEFNTIDVYNFHANCVQCGDVRTAERIDANYLYDLAHAACPVCKGMSRSCEEPYVLEHFLQNSVNDDRYNTIVVKYEKSPEGTPCTKKLVLGHRDDKGYPHWKFTCPRTGELKSIITGKSDRCEVEFREMDSNELWHAVTGENHGMFWGDMRWNKEQA